MLAYAANAPRHAERRPSPNAMLAIVAAHVAVVAAVMSAKLDLPPRIKERPTVIEWIDPVKPPAEPVHHPVRPQSGPIVTHQPAPDSIIIGPSLRPGPTTVDLGVITGGGASVTPEIPPPSRPVPVKFSAQLLTPSSELKPPYPHEKLLSEEEAVLKLRLSIDERGRVIAVEPVGRADPVFLKAARQYLIAHWRYRPASEDDRAIPSSTVITLRFTLEG